MTISVAMHWRSTLARSTLLLLIGCASPSEPVSGDSLRSISPVGSYTLRQIDGISLPWTNSATGVSVLSGAIHIHEGGNWTAGYENQAASSPPGLFPTYDGGTWKLVASDALELTWSPPAPSGTNPGAFSMDSLVVVWASGRIYSYSRKGA